MSEDINTPDPNADIPDELKERYRLTSVMIHNHRGTEKVRYNHSAQATIDMFKKALPELDDKTVFTVFSSVAYMLSTIMLTPLAKAGPEVEELFDVYTLAAASLLGVIDLNDETDPPTQEQLKVKALEAEIIRLRELIEAEDDVIETPGLYL